ncbi:MAG: hypothetical protein GSR86_05560 [Desulfurococcales archaeon]|nr:hypothetical protein [Desulfurococcales archaeon]
MHASPRIEELSAILEDPIKKAQLVLASHLHDASRGECRIDLGRGAWYLKLEHGDSRLELVIVDMIVVAASGYAGGERLTGSRVLDVLKTMKGPCIVELYRIDIDKLEYGGELREAASLKEPPYYWVGASLYNYKVHSVVAEGSFSYILKADGATGTVALKVLKRDSVGRKRIFKFIAENSVQAWLSMVDEDTVSKAASIKGARSLVEHILDASSNIVRVMEIHAPLTAYDEDTYRRMPPAAVLELMEGDASRLGPGEDLAAIAYNVLRALALAHMLGVGHFDMKPSNILYRITGSGRIYKLTDFSGYINTGSGMLVENVTPSYTDPLLIASRGRGVGLDSDVFNYMSLVYRLATGSPPYCVLAVNNVMLSKLTGSKPVLPKPPDYARSLYEKLLKASRSSGAASLLREVVTLYEECILDEVKGSGIQEVLGGEWGEAASRSLTLDKSLRFRDAVDLALKLKDWMDEFKRT